MKRIPEPYWDLLAAEVGPRVVGRYRTRLEGSATFRETAPADDAARAFLDRLAAEGYLQTDEELACPQCPEPVSPEEADERLHRCGFSFEHEKPESRRVYFRRGLRSRDPRWLVTVHGMNTRGAWQEEFTWKLAQVYGQAIPVDTYKYGLVLLTPLLLPRQELYAKLLLDRLRARRHEMAAAGYGDRPDVICHSFGTWLLARALELDSDLCLGRVVLTASVVPPDFDWSVYVGGTKPRVEAVLCHFGGRDGVAPLAQFFVPRSGPSGRRGFNPQPDTEGRLLHRFEPDFKHSDYFVPAHLNRVVGEVWGDFLTAAVEDLGFWKDPTSAERSKVWRPSRWRYLTRPLKYGLLLSLVLAALVLAELIALGAAALWIFRDLLVLLPTPVRA